MPKKYQDPVAERLFAHPGPDWRELARRLARWLTLASVAHRRTSTTTERN
jgi:hypothetical protein